MKKQRIRLATDPDRVVVTVRIEQTINDASDPDRVVTDTRRAIREALSAPISIASVSLRAGPSEEHSAAVP